MPLPQRPHKGLRDPNQERRDRETFNSILNHSFDDSRRQTDTEKLLGITPVNPAYPPGHIFRYGAVPSSPSGTQTDCSFAIQAACDQAVQNGSTVVIPGTLLGAYYRCNSAIDLDYGVRIETDGTRPTIRFYGCNGFNVPDETSLLNISGLELFSLESDGTADPLVYTGINITGNNGGICTYMVMRDLFMRGWLRAINGEYVQLCTIDNVSTDNCEVAVRLFGQSVNNVISNCRLTVTGGTHSIQLVKDGATRGEGLMIVNCVLASGDYGIQTDGWLSLNVSNCVIDLIQDRAIEVTNVPSLCVTNSWIYAANYGIKWESLGTLVDQEASIVGNRIEVTAANAKGLLIDSNNKGISVIGNTITGGPSGSGRCIYFESGAVDLTAVGNHFINAGSNAAVFVVGTGFRHNGNTGDISVEYNTAPAYTGTLTQCTTAPTAAIVYAENGDIITIRVPSLKATSANTNQPKITGMPAAIAPLSIQAVQGFVLDNSVEAISKVVIDTNGDIILYNVLSATFTAANDKGTDGMTFTYRRS
jgi:hypothetical protein